MNRRLTFGKVWPWVALVFFAVDVVLLYAAPSFHRAVFEGELGIVELPTFLFLLAAVPFAIRGARRSEGASRALFVALALGCLFWGSEEVDWGQTFFHWATPAGLAAHNYQHEMNLHNTRGAVGTITNVVPRFVLLTLCVLSVILNAPVGATVERFLTRFFPAQWGEILKRCWVPAGLAVADSILNKLRPERHYRGYGEIQEMFTAVFLLLFTVLLLRAPREGAFSET